ncbi:multidrug transporter [Xenorhabdus vietnamensis]|uniref:Multidrug transporter n=1 Tax=Xenorhabdus vietnamensis TaxID=351656 RepID=A0A1Y2SGY1_9GAMM|nr:MFS transporter [Xenorhabdus vietnamensis]OTA17260.1 multidrug transporter [Xenorhabdus vietnamensis]
MNYRNKVAVVYLLGFFLDLVNMFISNVAYPTIGKEMHASVAELAWISNGYICGLTLIIPLSAWLTQRAGARRVFLLSLALFALGTAASGFAHSLEELVFCRVVQGIGGGLLIPVGQALTWQLYAKHERAKLSSVIMLVALLAPALSPAVGGVLVQTLNWRWVFFASLPPTLLTLILAFIWLQDGITSEKNKILDLSGLVIGCASLFLILLGMTKISDAGGTAKGTAFFLSGAILLAFFIIRSSRHPAPLFSFHLLSDPLMRFSMLVYQFVPGMFMGVSLVGVIYLQTFLGMSAAETGALMIPWSLASFLAITVTGKTFNRLGPRPLIMTGCLLQVIGILLLSVVTHDGQNYLLVMAFALMGMGGSLCSSTAQSSAFLEISATAMPEASALWNINRQLSFCFGVALLSLLLNLLISHLALREAYMWTFYTAAAGALIPLLLSLNINNRNVKLNLLSEENN